MDIDKVKNARNLLDQLEKLSKIKKKVLILNIVLFGN